MSAKEHSRQVPRKTTNLESTELKNLREVWKDSSCSRVSTEVDDVKELAGFCKAIANQVLCAAMNADSLFSIFQLKHLENIAVSFYLRAWLENCANTKQGLSSFAKKKYVLSNEPSISGIPPDDFHKALQRAAEKYREMQDLRQVQVAQEGSSSGTFPNTQEGKAEGYNFLSLRQFDADINKKLELFTLLTSRKDVMSVRSEKDNYSKLKEECQRYNQFLQEIQCIQSPREYVVACMHIQEVERSTYFYFIQSAAKRLIDATANKQTKLDAQEYLSKCMQIIWSRYEFLSVVFPGVVLENIPYNVFFYDGLFANVIENKEMENNYYLWRNLLTEVINLMVLLKPPKEQPFWNDTEFDLAKKFFKDEYCLLKNYTPPQFSDFIDTNPYFAIVIEFYNHLNYVDSPLRMFRETTQGARKKRNQKKTKKM